MERVSYRPEEKQGEGFGGYNESPQADSATGDLLGR